MEFRAERRMLKAKFFLCHQSFAAPCHTVFARDGERGMAGAGSPLAGPRDRTDSGELSPLSPPPRPCSTPQLAPRPRLRAPFVDRAPSALPTPRAASPPPIDPEHSTADCLEPRAPFLRPSIGPEHNLEPLCAHSYIAWGRSAHANSRIKSRLEAGPRHPMFSHWTGKKGA